MNTGEILRVTIEKTVYGGSGLARVGGRVVFVPGAAPGEQLEVRVAQLKKSYAVAEICAVLAPSPDRIQPDCRVTAPSGAAIRIPGCVYDHISYAAELRIKAQQLSEFMQRFASAAAQSATAPFAAPAHRHYRNKLTLHTEKRNGCVTLGYREERSHRVVEIPECPLSCAAVNGQLSVIRSSPEFRALPDGATLTIRHTPHDGTLWWTGRPSQRSWLTEESAIGPLRVSSDGFYQVNPAVCQALTRTVAEWYAAAPAPEVLDLYCGVGLFGLACARAGGARLTGIESGKRAVLAARHNAAARAIPADFHVRELGRSPIDFAEYLKSPPQALCIIDPPRAGMDKTLAQAVARSGIGRILLISCDPATLQRDIGILLHEGGYRLVRSQLFDMFPRTAHFETLAELSL
jgi:23S rRNA (uracil1939-C5)-methyltransferase